MPSERVQQQIDGLLNDAEAAIKAADWELVLSRAGAALSLDDTNEDAIAYLRAARLNLEREPERPAKQGSETVPGSYEYHSVNVRGMTWSIGGRIDSLTARMSEAGWEFVGQSELRAPSTSGLDRQVEVKFRRVKTLGAPPPPVGGMSWGCLLPLISALFFAALAILVVFSPWV